MNIFIITLLATLFTYAITALGAATIFFFKNIKENFLDTILGFASGVMIAASFFSLLLPSLEQASALNQNVALIITGGFLFGCLFVFLSDIYLDKIMKKNKSLTISKKRSILLVSAITIHNIPEGLSIGVAIAGASLGVGGAELSSALLLALGIGIQNFPEGMGTSLPLLKEGYTKKKAFLLGQASGLVEIIAGLLGVLLSTYLVNFLPFLLSFAAGCMIIVVCRELLPESIENSKNKATIGLIIGFVIMMILDISLG